MKKKIIDIICLVLAAGVVGGIAGANLLHTNRPTVSEMENRKLAEMPEFTFEGLTDGSYFKGISAFVSDTFPERDRLVALSKKMDTLKGMEYKPSGGDSFILLEGWGNSAETTASNVDDILDQAFADLTKPETTSPDPMDMVESTPVETIPWEDDFPESELWETMTPETSAPETIPWDETSAPETAPSDETSVPETEGAETIPEVRGLSLSKDSVKLTVGSGTVLYAYLDTDDPNPGNVRWSVSDGEIASISINPNGGIDVKGLAEGSCVIRCRYKNKFQATCRVTVASITSVSQTQQDTAADFLTNGNFIYGDAVYTQAYFSSANAGYYARTAAYYKSLFGEDVGMNVVVAPVSSVVLDNPAVTSNIANQGVILEQMKALMDSSVNFVDTYTPIYEHRDEYLYFKSDHHWTQRGAYYAYTAYAESVGLTPTPLEDFDFTIRNESYSGSMYMYTQDARVKNFTDTIEVFVSRKPHTMTVTTGTGATSVYNSAVAEFNKTYVTFIAGDNPYTVINVPENPQDFNVLVLKDSFGNAFVPFLCEHYGNIIVVDTRYATFNIYEQLKDYGISDIVFVNNIQAANSYSWSKMYLSAVGVNLE